MNPQPKPLKRRTVKAKRDKAKAANIGQVRDRVMERDRFDCRVPDCCCAQDEGIQGVAELAHIRGRGMGGNKDLSRDTTANTIACCQYHHTGSRSLHSGHVKIRPLTEKGADGPLCFEFYEKLPSEL